MNLFQNVRVLELANVLAGPSVGMFFAELGADVIKVENLRTQGDVTRSWRLPNESAEDGISAYFSAVNWGKQSLAVDLKQVEGQRVVQQLAMQSDIVLASYLPGAAARLGVDAQRLRDQKPSLIYAELSGYGPEEERAAFDAIIQAEVGFMEMNGVAPGEGHKMPVALMDVLAAHQLKEAILLAYLKRLQTGAGSHLQVSLIQAGLASLANQATNYLMQGHQPQAQGSAHPNIVPYGTRFPTRDGSSVVLAVGNDRQFAALCQVLDIAVPPGWATNPGRVADRAAVNEALKAGIARWERAALLEVAHRAHIPMGAVNSMAEALALPQATELMLRQGPCAGLRTFVGQGVQPPSSLSAPPSLSQHAHAILCELLGYSSASLNEWRKKSIVL